MRVRRLQDELLLLHLDELLCIDLARWDSVGGSRCEEGGRGVRLHKSRGPRTLKKEAAFVPFSSFFSSSYRFCPTEL